MNDERENLWVELTRLAQLVWGDSKFMQLGEYR